MKASCAAPLLQALCDELQAVQQRLDELREWCPEQSCCGAREAAVSALRQRLSRLLRCTQELSTRSQLRISEWREISSSVSNTYLLLIILTNCTT